VGDEGFLDLHGTVERFESSGVPVISLIAASGDDWDRYQSLHWRACEAWLAENPQHREADDLRATHERHKAHYLRVARSLLGWAILVGAKPG